jgi:hypothetical protein
MGTAGFCWKGNDWNSMLTFTFHSCCTYRRSAGGANVLQILFLLHLETMCTSLTPTAQLCPLWRKHMSLKDSQLKQKQQPHPCPVRFLWIGLSAEAGAGWGSRGHTFLGHLVAKLWQVPDLWSPGLVSKASLPHPPAPFPCLSRMKISWGIRIKDTHTWLRSFSVVF